MQIIPVIDLLNGEVVHAKRGDRQHYLPVKSSLCPSSKPLDTCRALMELYPFNRLYIADINAIQKTATHFKDIQAIKNEFPSLEIWLDAGYDSVDRVKEAESLGLDIVLGSESIANMQQYQDLSLACGNRHILSLDFKRFGQEEQFSGPEELYSTITHWPARIIAMTLDKVGSNTGPDFKRLQTVQNKSSTSNVYAAGGVRNNNDLQQLKNQGIKGVLVASALHNGMLDSDLLESIHK